MPYRPQIMHTDVFGADDASRLVDDALNLYFGLQDRKEQQTDRELQREQEDFIFRSDIEADPRYTTERPSRREARGPVLEGAERFEPKSVRETFAGARPGMAAGARPEPAAFGMAAGTPGRSPLTGPVPEVETDRAPGDRSGGMIEGVRSLADEVAPRPTGRPRVLPGQFVPGMGFSPTAVYDTPPVEGFRFEDVPTDAEPFARVGETEVYREPGYQPPEQQAAQQQQRLMDLVGRAQQGDEAAARELMVLDRQLYNAATAEQPLSFAEKLDLVGRAEGGDEQAARELLVRAPDLYDEILGDDEPDTITRYGRRFPDTSEGRAAATEWARQQSAAVRAPRRGEDPDAPWSEEQVLNVAFDLLEDHEQDIGSTIDTVEAELEAAEAEGRPVESIQAVLDALYDLRAEQSRRGFLGIGGGGGGGVTFEGLRRRYDESEGGG